MTAKWSPVDAPSAMPRVGAVANEVAGVGATGSVRGSPAPRCSLFRVGRLAVACRGRTVYSLSTWRAGRQAEPSVTDLENDAALPSSGRRQGPSWADAPRRLLPTSRSRHEPWHVGGPVRVRRGHLQPLARRPSLGGQRGRHVVARRHRPPRRNLRGPPHRPVRVTARTRRACRCPAGRSMY